MFHQSQGDDSTQAAPMKEWLARSGRVSRAGCLLLFATLLLGIANRAAAQTGQGSITGKVTDTTGAMVPGATVEVTNNDTQVTLTTKSNADGVYSVFSLNPGDYTVTVTGKGFEKEVISQVTVRAAQQPTINVSLKVGKETSEVTVVAQDALLSSDTSDVTTTVDHQIVENLPYPDRSSLEAVLLVPGVTGDPSVPGGIFSENPVITTGPVVPGASITVGGAAPGTTSILVDGSDITQGSYPRTGINLSGQIVQETTVITTGLSAKYGRTSGGLIIQATKSGTNQYHGGFTYRHTDPFFQAYPSGSTLPPNDHENYYGLYVGGPVWIPKIYDGHDKTFFFVGVEPARVKNYLGYPGQFDTPADLAGQLHNTFNSLNQTVLAQQGYAAAVAAARTGGVFYQTAAASINAQGFPNGPYVGGAGIQTTGPAGLDDVSAELANNPFAQYVVSQLPSPTNPGPYIHFYNPQATYNNVGDNASYQRGVSDVDNRYSFRIDHLISNSDQIWGRYTYVPITGTRIFALALTNPLNQVPTDTVLSHDIALGYTHVFSGNIVNNARYSVLRVNEQRLPYAAALSKDWAGSYGLTPATLHKGFPDLSVLGSSTLQVGAETPYGDIDQNFIAGDDVTWTHGNHLFQFGVDVRWIQSNQYDTSLEYGGKYSFGNGQTSGTYEGPSGANNEPNTGTGLTGNALGTFILGLISTYSAAPVAVPGYYRWRYYAGYFQDNWHATPKLTLNLGLRYEVATPREEKFNNQAILQPNITGVAPNGLATPSSFCFSGSCGTGRMLWPINWYGLEPRIGIDYAATPRTTIRASYGIMRLPLTGYENTPDPDFNIASATVTNLVGGTNPSNETDYITNPVGHLTSAYTALGGNRGPIGTSTGVSPVFVSQTNAVPYNQSYSVTLQYEPAAKTLLQATYQGLKGTHLIGPTTGSTPPFPGSLNLPNISTLIAAIQNHVNFGGTSANKYGLATNETGLQQLNPYQNFYSLPLLELYPRTGTSEYNAFYFNVTQRMTAGITLLAYYSWTKSMDNVAETNAGNSGNFGSAPPQNPFDTNGEWTVSSYDQPSRLKAGYVYILPIGQGKLVHTHSDLLNNLIGNMSTSGIVTIASGYPNFVIFGSVGNFESFPVSGSGFGSPTPGLPTGYNLRPNITPGVPLINPAYKHGHLYMNNPFGLTQYSAGVFQPYLNPAAFGCNTSTGTCVAPGSVNNPALGNEPRTLPAARSPREFMFDARFTKGFRVKEKYELKLFANLNNALNHPVYFGANNTASDPLTTTSITTTTAPPSITLHEATSTFGRLNETQSAGMSRVVRIGAEFTF